MKAQLVAERGSLAFTAACHLPLAGRSGLNSSQFREKILLMLRELCRKQGRASYKDSMEVFEVSPGFSALAPELLMGTAHPTFWHFLVSHGFVMQGLEAKWICFTTTTTPKPAPHHHLPRHRQ